MTGLSCNWCEIKDIAESKPIYSIPDVTFQSQLSDKDGNVLQIIPGQGIRYLPKPKYSVITIAVSIGITGRNFTVMWEGYGIVPQNYLDAIPEGRWTTYLDNSGWHTLADMSTEGYKFQLA